MPHWRLTQIWDIVAVLTLGPVIALMAAQLPGDWQIHNGSSHSGTATVVRVEPFRFGTHIQVDVADKSGTTVARHQELNGDAKHVLGARLPVDYLPPDGQGQTQVYVHGHDPYITNLWVFIACFTLFALAFVRASIRMWRLSRRRLSRNRPNRARSYRAGYGYTPD